MICLFVELLRHRQYHSQNYALTTQSVSLVRFLCALYSEDDGRRAFLDRFSKPELLAKFFAALRAASAQWDLRVCAAVGAMLRELVGGESTEHGMDPGDERFTQAAASVFKWMEKSIRMGMSVCLRVYFIRNF